MAHAIRLAVLAIAATAVAVIARASAFTPAWAAAHSGERVPPPAPRVLVEGRPPRACAIQPRQLQGNAPQGFRSGAMVLGTTALLLSFAATSRSAQRALTVRRLRLAGKDIPRNKEIAWALMCAVYGIGKTTAFKILKDTGINPHKRTYELTNYTLENPLKRMYKANCALLLEIKHQRGIR